MRFKFNYYWLLLLLPFFFITWYLLTAGNSAPARYLPYFGPRHALKVNDTTYHFVPAFSFTSQLGTIVDTSTIRNKVYVTEYFFTTCQSICPVMNNNLQKVYNTFKDRNDVMILSHTVDPENDSVPVLLQYARNHGVNDSKWLFLTGKKSELYSLARKGYLLNAEEGTGGPEDFIHTQNFALVDKERHLRGFYDGTDSLEVDRLIKEIRLLVKEYEQRDKTGA